MNKLNELARIHGRLQFRRRLLQAGESQAVGGTQVVLVVAAMQCGQLLHLRLAQAGEACIGLNQCPPRTRQALQCRNNERSTSSSGNLCSSPGPVGWRNRDDARGIRQDDLAENRVETNEEPVHPP